MKLPSILSESAQVAQIVAEKLTETDKPTIYASAYTIALSITSFAQWFSESLTQIGILTGIVGVLILARLNHKTTKLREVETLLKQAELEAAQYEAEQRRAGEENARLENRILREKMKNMGVELRRDEDKKS
jgi:hypothetical protein